MHPAWLLLLLPLSLSSFIQDDGQFDELPGAVHSYDAEQLKEFVTYSKEAGIGHCFSKKRKSPINIDLGNVTVVSFPPLDFKHYSVSENVTENIESNFTASIHGFSNWTRQPVLSGGPLNEEYYLMEVRWDKMDLAYISLPMLPQHHGHFINNIAPNFELHFVHTKGGLSVEEARLLPDGLVILAVFINQVHTANHQSYYDSPYQAPRVEPGVEFNWTSPETFLPNQRDVYFTYTGTPIQPPCTGDATWIILATPITMTDVELRFYTQTATMGGISLSDYNMTKRTQEVFFHANQVLSVSSKPSSSNAAAIVLGVIAAFICGVVVGLFCFYMRKKFFKKTADEEKEDRQLAVKYQKVFDNVSVS